MHCSARIQGWPADTHTHTHTHTCVQLHHDGLSLQLLSHHALLFCRCCCLAFFFVCLFLLTCPPRSTATVLAQHGVAHPISCLAVHPQDTMLVDGSVDGLVRLWSLTPGRAATDQEHPFHVLAKHKAAITDVCFSFDGSLVSSASLDNTAIIWDCASGLLALGCCFFAGQ